MLHTLTSQLGLIILFLVCSLIVAKGAPAERAAALLVAATWAGLLVCQALTAQVIPEIPLLVSDAILATGFLVLALRYASLWLGAGMLFQGAAFTMHLIHMTEPAAQNRFYVATVNFLSYAVLATVAGAACVTWFKRARSGRAERTAPAAELVIGP